MTTVLPAGRDVFLKHEAVGADRRRQFGDDRRRGRSVAGCSDHRKRAGRRLGGSASGPENQWAGDGGDSITDPEFSNPTLSSPCRIVLVGTLGSNRVLAAQEGVVWQPTPVMSDVTSLGRG